MADASGSKGGADSCNRRQPERQDYRKRGLSGYDGGKKVKGRKRHIVVDTFGFPLALEVHTADIQDRDGGISVTQAAQRAFPSLRKLWADSGYSCKFVQAIEAATDLTVEVVKHPTEGRRLAWARNGEAANVPPVPAGFQVVRWRWIVERTFAWMSRNRRLAKDYEESIASSMAWMWLTLIRLLAARLAR